MENATHSPPKRIRKHIYETQLPQTLTPQISSFIYNNTFHIINIIRKITIKIEQMENAHNLHTTFFNDLKLIISHVQIVHVNKLNQKIKQITQELRKLFFITFPKTKNKNTEYTTDTLPKIRHLKQTIQNAFYQNMFYQKELLFKICSSINNNLFKIKKIIRRITTKIKQIKIHHNLQTTFFIKHKLIFSHEQIRHIININQSTNQLTKNLNEFFAIIKHATPPK